MDLVLNLIFYAHLNNPVLQIKSDVGTTNAKILLIVVTNYKVEAESANLIPLIDVLMDLAQINLPIAQLSSFVQFPLQLNVTTELVKPQSANVMHKPHVKLVAEDAQMDPANLY